MFDRTVKDMLRWIGGLELHIPPCPRHPEEQVSQGDVLLSEKPTHCYDRYHPFQERQNH